MKSLIVILSILVLCGPVAAAPKACKSAYFNCAAYKRIGRTFAVCVRWQVTCVEM